MNNPVIGFAGIGTGFADPVADSQNVFRRILDATSHPGRIVDIGPGNLAANGAGLSEAAAGLALALLDFETPAWIDSALASCGDYLRFHCGAPLVATPGDSRFAFAADITQLPDLTKFNLGTPDFPERSTTLVIEVPGLADAAGLMLRGPGIETRSALRIDGLPVDFWKKRANLATLFPLGIDLVLTCGRRLAAIPRTTTVEI